MHLGSFEKTNIKSKKVREFRLILSILACFYLIGFGFFVSMQMIGESYPKTWNSIATLINGMSIKFTLDKAGLLLNHSLAFFILSVILGIAFWLLRWQILRTGLLGTALLGLSYLSCAVLLLIVQSWMAHVVILGLIAVLFVISFVVQSNILIYLRDGTYFDVFLESLIALGFLLFIGRMLMMALMGG